MDREELKLYTGPYTGGLTMTSEMLSILKQPAKYLHSIQDGGQKLRELYQDEATNWSARKLSMFGLACYFGELEAVISMVQSGQAPSLSSHETPFHWDYVSIVIFGAQRSSHGPSLKHLETLEFLLSRGASPNSIDIVGFTALQHACTIQTTNEPPKYDPQQPMDAATYARLVQIPHIPQTNKMTPLLRTLIKHGANVDHQNRYGEVAMFLAFPTNNVDFIDILLEHGASLDIPEADGLTPRNTFIRYGPQVTSCVTKWIRKREGINAPREGGQKRCGWIGCDKPGGEKDGKSTLMICSRCQVERYCSTQCQKKAWAEHKKVCKPFDTSTTIVLIPNYDEIGSLQSTANFARSVFGYDQHLPTPKNTNRGARVPRTKPGKSNIKNIIVKVQIAMKPTAMYGMTFDSNSFDPHGNLLIYTKNRDLVCTIRRKDQIGGVSAPGVGAGERAFDKLVQTIMTKGIGGAKGYFSAVLKSKKELVIKVEDMLAEQPF
ncbi:ankyrin repeat-containing domain protein [Lentinula edodes]|uniref:ankyrin repeat-containing domain protein n=1 Tax=Lentinula edodes TaxID=5353 RepID=UPI001E8D5CCD|nr:ankyrin repeat-containing domain protein [Lentinula edodes]KAH7874556.1 ankyrin repeat-containing domain protein [Lentinula edodes]